MADAYQPVTVHVPEERLAEFYEFFGAWLARNPTEADKDTPPGLDDRIMKH